MKTCSKCKIEKDEAEFSKNASKKDGLDYRCKLCLREYQRTDSYNGLYAGTPENFVPSSLVSAPAPHADAAVLHVDQMVSENSCLATDQPKQSR